MKKFLSLLLALAMILSFTACGSNTAPAETAEASKTAETKPTATAPAPVQGETKTGSLKIGISTNAIGNAHNRHQFEGMTNIAKERGHEVVQANANGAAAQQATDIENLIAAGCDVICVQNGDKFSLQNAVNEALKAGIRVISYDTGWMDGIDTMFQLNSMKVQADICMLLAAEVGFKGKVITTGHQDNFALRSGSYIHDAFLAEYDFEKVAHVQTTYPGTTEVTYNGLDSALTAYPDVVAIFTSQDLEAMGAVQALKEHGLDDKVKCVGVDGEIDTLNDILAGGPTICTAISDLDGANAAIVDACEKLVAGETVLKYNDIPYNIVTAANAAEYLEKAKADAIKYAE